MINGYLFVLILIFGCMYWLYSMANLGVKRRDRAYNQEETEIIQELHRGLEKMAQRIEALETILLDRSESSRRTASPVSDPETADRY